MRFILPCLLLFIFGFSHMAKAEIFIGKKHGIILSPITATVSAGQFKWFPLSGENYEQIGSESFEITITVNSIFPDIGAYICDEQNLKLLVNKQSFRCFGVAKGNNTFKIEGNRYSSQPHFLVFNNSYSLLTDKYVSAHIYVTNEISDTFCEELKTAFTEVVNGLHDYFEVPEFDVSLAPCKSENAFSTTKGGHITICSELVFGAFLDKNEGAFISVFLHELGHTVLNLWGQPHYSNERTADEFAIAVLLMDADNRGETLIYDWIDWFKQHEYLEGEIAAMLSGDQHPLTAQRISAIEQILASRGDFQRRWANSLYPHMTNKALSEIISNPYAGANIELAESILKNREKLKN